MHHALSPCYLLCCAPSLLLRLPHAVAALQYLQQEVEQHDDNEEEEEEEEGMDTQSL